MVEHFPHDRADQPFTESASCHGDSRIATTSCGIPHRHQLHPANAQPPRSSHFHRRAAAEAVSTAARPRQHHHPRVASFNAKTDTLGAATTTTIGSPWVVSRQRPRLSAAERSAGSGRGSHAGTTPYHHHPCQSAAHTSNTSGTAAASTIAPAAALRTSSKLPGWWSTVSFPKRPVCRSSPHSCAIKRWLSSNCTRFAISSGNSSR